MCCLFHWWCYIPYKYYIRTQLHEYWIYAPSSMYMHIWDCISIRWYTFRIVCRRCCLVGGIGRRTFVLKSKNLIITKVVKLFGSLTEQPSFLPIDGFVAVRPISMSFKQMQIHSRACFARLYNFFNFRVSVWKSTWMRTITWLWYIPSPRLN